jgi:hypothetical protein
MPFFEPVPAEVRPTYNRLLAWMLFRAPVVALIADLAALIAVKSLGAPAWEVAILAAAPPLGNLLAVFWSQRVARSANKIRYFFWPEIVTSTLLILIAFTRNSHTFTIGLWMFLLLRAPLVLVHSSVLRMNYPAQWRSWLLARALALSQIVTASAGLIFGQLLETEPAIYRLLFPLAGLCGLMGAFQVRRIVLRSESSSSSGKEGAGNGEGNGNGPAPDYSLGRILRVLREDDRFRRYEFSFSLFGFANIMTLPVIPLFLEKRLGIHYGAAGLILVTIPMLIDTLMLPQWGKICDRHNPLLMRAVFNFIFSCGPLIYTVSTSLWMFATGRAIIGIVQGGSGLVWVLGINYFARREDVPVYMGIHQSLTGIRGLIAPFAGIGLAALFHNNYRIVFLAAFLLMNAGTLVMVSEVFRERRRTGGKLLSYAQIESQIDEQYTA